MWLFRLEKMVVCVKRVAPQSSEESRIFSNYCAPLLPESQGRGGEGVLVY